MRLSLLDRSRTRAGHPDGAALHDTIARARHAEELGLHRFWVAEHHGVPGVASGSPPVLPAAVGAATSSIRLGSGGVMLPHHQPLVVAEQFRMLDALHPGRIDLGVGRSLGFTAPVRRALRHDPVPGSGSGSGSDVDAVFAAGADAFAADVEELRAHLDGTSEVTVRPATGRTIPLHVLATGRGLLLAARLGLPVVVGGPVLASADVGDALAAYRSQFRPHPGGPEHPRVTISLDAFVADDAAEARELALPEAHAMALSRTTGEFGPLQSPTLLRAEAWPEQVRRRVEAHLDQTLAGTAPQVRAALEELVERTGAEEVLASTSTWDHAALLEADRALAAAVLGS
ncbi:MsnO8 family LLM class oxidoreductase [Nocardioides zeae]|uniref:MsnO8 family LLM class oxidoreductase n=1 Tax=Nocardioides zeae TaxID=1457234 RepID=UPI0030846715